MQVPDVMQGVTNDVKGAVNGMKDAVNDAYKIAQDTMGDMADELNAVTEQI